MHQPSGRISAEEIASKHQEWLASNGLRSTQGSFYTPFDVVERVIDLALGDSLNSVTSLDALPKFLDPSCGTGNFLILVARRLATRLSSVGLSYKKVIDCVVKDCLYGLDIDKTALQYCAENLSGLTEGRVKPSELLSHLVEMDALQVELPINRGEPNQLTLFDGDREARWADLFPSVFERENPGFDVVIGNPPFLNQLASETSLDRAALAKIQSIYGDVIRKTTNPASIFFLLSMSITRRGGSISLVQPLSFLAVRDSSGVREVLAESVKSIWICIDQVFEASVSTVVVTVTPKVQQKQIELFEGRAQRRVGQIDPFSARDQTWSRAISCVKGFPTVRLDVKRTLSDICDVASDFRDQYYGLVGHVVEKNILEDSDMKLATVGLVNPAEFSWGRTSTKFAKETFTHPVVETEGLTEKMRHWAESRKRPKVIVATQTRVLECFVDCSGDVLPSVPLLSIFALDDQLFRVAAVLTSPVASLVGAERHLGAGMSADVLKLSGQDLLRLPLPQDEIAWGEAAELLSVLQDEFEPKNRAEMLGRIGQLMNVAYHVKDESVFQWWWGRLPGLAPTRQVKPSTN